MVLDPQTHYMTFTLDPTHDIEMNEKMKVKYI